jgi:type IV secretory pathway VirD2 relaxase
MPSNDTHGMKLQVRRHAQLGKNDIRSLNRGMKLIMRIATATSKAKRTAASKAALAAWSSKHSQRAAVRVTYANARTPGQWKAHGSYLERESASGKELPGFDAEGTFLPVAETLDAWQKADDPRMFKIILSPENGDQLNLEAYTRSVMGKVQRDVAAPLEWVAVVHYNTDHPHVHVALRSVTKDDRELRFPKDYVRSGFRNHAQEAATEQLGFRTEKDVARVRQREISQSRLTSLDRSIAKLKPAEHPGDTFAVSFNLRAINNLKPEKRAEIVAMAARLRTLEGMGLASQVNDTTWAVSSNFVDVLKTVQMAGDRQKTLARQMALASDMNMPVVVEDWQKLTTLEGRVLGHGEEELKGKRFMLIEGTDGKLHYLTHRRETEQLREQHQLRANEFITFTRTDGALHIKQHGHAEAILSSAGFLKTQPVPPTGQELRPGWLGKYDAAIVLYQLDTEKDMPSKEETLAGGSVNLNPQPSSTLPVEGRAIPSLPERFEEAAQQIEFAARDSEGEITRDAARAQNLSRQASAADVLQMQLNPQALNVDLVHSQEEAAANTIDKAEPSRAQQERELREAQAIATAALGKHEFDIYDANYKGASYNGEVLGLTESYVITQQGADVILHDKRKLDKTPGLGELVSINYNATPHKAQVIERGHEKELGLEL